MSYSVDTRLESLKTDISSLASMSAENLKTFLKQKFTKLSKEENEKLLTKVQKEIDQKKQEIRDARKNLRSFEVDGGSSGTRDNAARDDRNDLKELNKVLQLINQESKVAATKEVQDVVKHNFDLKDGKDINVSPLKLDGETYTYAMGGGGLSKQPAELDNKTTEESDDRATGESTNPIPESAVTNEHGEVIRDANLDGLFNYADIPFAEKQKKDPLNTQKIFFNMTSQNIQLVSADREAGECTFKIYQENKYAYLKVTGLTFTEDNASNVSFYFNGVNTPSEDAFRNMPTWLLSNMYQGENQTSIQDQLFPKEVTKEEQLKAIQGYQDLMSKDAFNTLNQQLSLQGATYETYKKNVDLLFGVLNDPTQNKDQVAAQIIGQSKKEDLYALVYNIATNGKQKGIEYLKMFFGPTLSMIEAALGDPASTTLNDKLLILFLENQTGATGNFGGPEIWKRVFPSGTEPPYSAGEWTSETDQKVNLGAIQLVESYKNIIKLMGLAPTGVEDEAIRKITAYRESLIPKDEFMDNFQKIKLNPEGTKSLSQDKWFEFLNLVNGSLFLPDGAIRENAWEIIENAIHGENTPLSQQGLAKIETQNSTLENAALTAGGVGIGAITGLGTAAALGTIGAIAGDALFGAALAVTGPVGWIIGGVGAIIGGAVALIGALAEAADRDEMLANFIVVMDAVCSEKLKQALFGKIAPQAIQWLYDDSDGITETKADNEDAAMTILNQYLGPKPPPRPSQPPTAPREPTETATA